MNQFEVIDATFKPRRTDNLVDGADKWIGRNSQWQAYWVIEDGEYAGEWAMTLCNNDDRLQAPFAWVPLSDLET